MREILPRISIRYRLSKSQSLNRPEELESGRKSIASEFDSGIRCLSKDETRPLSRIWLIRSRSTRRFVMEDVQQEKASF